jgi:glycosyltransferase involved in cell wall biosynthesis
MRVLYPGTQDEKVVGGPAPSTLATRLRRSMRRRWLERARSGWHSDNPVLPSFGQETADLVDEINGSNSDLIHLHWIVHMLSVSDIGRLTKPVVWTLHDMWTFCGGEHYTPEGENARFRKGYLPGNRPATERGPDLNRQTWEAKRKAWAHLHFTIVTPSSWLADCARQSALLSGADVHVIANPLDVAGVWQPLPRAAARTALRLAPGKKLILMGADGGTADARKGGDLLRDAMARVTHTSQGAVELMVYGQDKPADGQPWPCKVNWLGTIRDDRLLALAYCAADVMVVPSRQDNLPNTALEAQACGIPVVAFRIGGLPDIVTHRETGWLAQPFDTSDLAAGIEWVLADTARSSALSHASREAAVARYSPQVVARQYARVYEQAIATAARTS